MELLFCHKISEFHPWKPSELLSWVLLNPLKVWHLVKRLCRIRILTGHNYILLVGIFRRHFSTKSPFISNCVETNMWQEHASLSWQVLNLKLQRKDFLASSSQFHIYITILVYPSNKKFPDLKFLVLEFAFTSFWMLKLLFINNIFLWKLFVTLLSFLLFKIFRLQNPAQNTKNIFFLASCVHVFSGTIIFILCVPANI